MEFTAVGTILVEKSGVIVEVEGNFYQVSKSDCRKIIEIRESQGYKGLKEALHGAEMKFKITRGSNKALLVVVPSSVVTSDPILNPIPIPTPMAMTSPIWVNDSEGPEEGGYWESQTTIQGKKIKIECWKQKPANFNGGYGSELRHAIAANGQNYWCIPLGQHAFWPNANFD